MTATAADFQTGDKVQLDDKPQVWRVTAKHGPLIRIAPLTRTGRRPGRIVHPERLTRAQDDD